MIGLDVNPRFVVHDLQHPPPRRPGYGGLSKTEFQAIAVEHGPTAALEASREPASHRLRSLSPTHPIREPRRWFVVELLRDARDEDVRDAVEVIARTLIAGYCVDFYFPSDMDERDCLDFIRDIEKLAHAEERKQRAVAVKAIAIQIVEERLRGPPETCLQT